jgi:hypothetical protein
MPGIKVDWTLPTTRESGRPLAAAEIAAVVIEVSADSGVNYSTYGQYPSDQLTVTIPELEVGVWFVRGRVRDTDGRVSAPVAQSITLADTSPPSVLPTLTLALAA